MLDVIKYGTSKYGNVWILGTIKYQGFEVTDLFNTNIKDEKILENKKVNLQYKLFKISRNKDGKIVFFLEF